MRVWNSLMFCILLAFGQGCVWASTYEELERDHAALKASLAATQSDLTSTQGHLEKMERDLQSLRQQHADLSAKYHQVSQQKNHLENYLAEMKSELDTMEKRKAAAERRISEFKNLLSRFKSLIDAGKLKVKMVDGRMIVEMATDILFNSGSARLSPEGKDAIREVASVLASIPERKFQVEGHTDDIPIKTIKYPSNWELASSRALTVVKTMVESGMPAERISASSYGANRPAQANDTPEGRSANRRIEILLVPDLSNLPGFDELSKIEG